MENKVYEFCIDFHNGIVIEYQSIFLNIEDSSKLSVCRCDDGSIKSTQGICSIDLSTSSLTFMYDVFFLAAKIDEHKEIGGNWKFSCSTDSLKFNVYIVDVDVWSDNVEAIF